MLINGAPMTALELTARARSTHASLADIAIEVIERFEVDDKCAVVFRQSGRHVGRIALPGAIEPTGKAVQGIGIDVFTLADDRIASIWVLSDVLAQLVGPIDGG